MSVPSSSRREFLKAAGLAAFSSTSFAILPVRADDDPEARRKATNDLKQIALAMHNYLSTYDKFPASAIFDADGKPLLSWRVEILPYIEEGALYNEFKKDEPWDSEHNKALLAKMPKIYAPAVEKEGRPKDSTLYQGFNGTHAFFEGTTGRMIADFTDGTSNTVMIVEAGEAVPWTKPADLEFPEDPEKPLPKLGGQFENGFLAGFTDGSVKFLKNDVNPTILHKLITRNGGEVISADDF